MRDVLFTGSLPLQPASAVFESIATEVGDLTRRIPDGEQAGWIRSIAPQLARHPALELSHSARITTGGGPFDRDFAFFKVKAGQSELELGPYGVAAGAIDSYAQFRTLKERGTIAPGTRFQATVPGPMTTTSCIALPFDELAPIAEKPLIDEIRAIAAAIPHAELTIQIDLAVEVEVEEFRRRPAEIDMPICAYLDWTMEQSAQSAARLAAAVPADVELGFHLCGVWHIDKHAGQDLRVHVDYANLLARIIPRPIAYFHVPTVPEHDGADFAALAALELSPDTEFYLGVLHGVDGLEGARRRIAAAAQFRPDFGIGYFCGLSQFGAGPETIGPMLELHRHAAAL